MGICTEYQGTGFPVLPGQIKAAKVPLIVEKYELHYNKSPNLAARTRSGMWALTNVSQEQTIDDRCAELCNLLDADGKDMSVVVFGTETHYKAMMRAVDFFTKNGVHKEHLKPLMVPLNLIGIAYALDPETHKLYIEELFVEDL